MQIVCGQCGLQPHGVLKGSVASRVRQGRRKYWWLTEWVDVLLGSPPCLMKSTAHLNWIHQSKFTLGLGRELQ